MKDALKQFLVASLFLVGGLLSPSNGLDDKVDADPLSMLAVAGTAIVVGLVANQLYQRYVLSNKK